MDTAMTESLPLEFDFYHLGQISPAERPEIEIEGREAIAFSLNGDLRGMAALIYPSGTQAPGGDDSAWTELANVMASLWVTRLSKEQGLDVMISPPRRLTRGEWKNWNVIRSYDWKTKNGTLAIEFAAEVTQNA